MIRKQNKSEVKNTKLERKIIVTCAFILVVFVLTVWIATSGSLSYYTLLHALLAIVLLVLLYATKTLPKTGLHIMVVLGIIGAASAVWLVAAYFPYYIEHLKYIDSIK